MLLFIEQNFKNYCYVSVIQRLDQVFVSEHVAKLFNNWAKLLKPSEKIESCREFENLCRVFQKLCLVFVSLHGPYFSISHVSGILT